MKTSRFILAGSLLAALLTGLLPLQLAAAPAKEDVLIDFTDVRVDRYTGAITKSYEYDFGDWSKHLSDMAHRGCLVRSLTGKGGLGENNPMAEFNASPIVHLVFVIGKDNNAKSLNFSLEDSDGTEQTWNIPFENLSKGREYHFPLNLAQCTTEGKPGKKPGLNLKKIAKWEIKGDWSEPNVEVLLIKLVVPK